MKPKDAIALAALALLGLYVMTARATNPPRKRHDVDPCDAPADDWRLSRKLYDRWRAPWSPSYRETQHELWIESKDAAERGDYSKPVNHKRTLGRMHQHKLTQWDNARAKCKGEGDVRLYDDGADVIVSSRSDKTTWYRITNEGERKWHLQLEKTKGEPIAIGAFRSFEAAHKEAAERLAPAPF